MYTCLWRSRISTACSAFLLRAHSTVALNALDTLDAVNLGLERTDLALGYFLLDPGRLLVLGSP